MTGARAAFEKAKAKVEAEKAAELPEVAETEPERPWKNYRAFDVKNILIKQRFDLKEYEDLQIAAKTDREKLPESTLIKAQILVDALELLYQQMERAEEAEEDEE